MRIITTSVKAEHLRVLFGELLRFVQTSKIPWTVDKGGPLIINHMDLRKSYSGVRCPISYLWGMVSERGEGCAGHHAPYTLAVIDEASGVDNMAYEQMQGWAKRFLVFGNPNEPRQGNSFFKEAVKKGDILDTESGMNVVTKE